MEKNKRVLLIIILALALVLGGAGLLYRQLSAGYTPEQLSLAGGEQVPAASSPAAGVGAEDSQTAPDFTVYDAEGNAVKLSDYFGKPIVLNFWASWCGPCKMEMPDFHEKYLELGNEIHFLMINMTDGSRETVDSASKFIAEQEYTFPVFYDTESDASAAYGVYSLPTTFFIDAEGYAIAQATGAINMKILDKGIEMISQE